nr:50S ribosomal protein L22 [Bacteroidota bacterium]
LVLSAIANWQMKNEGRRIEESDLYIKEIQVDSGRVLKRIRPAPQGRAHRIRKRSNHVTIILDSLIIPKVDIEEDVEEVKKEAEPKVDSKATKATPKTKEKTEVKTKNKED